MTTEQAGEIEQLREAIKLTVSDASFHLKKYRPHCLEALEAALRASTPPAQPTADAVERAHEIWAMAQVGPNEGVEDAVQRIASALPTTMSGDYVVVLTEARDRIADMLAGDDGQAWKEARRTLEKLNTMIAASPTEKEN